MTDSERITAVSYDKRERREEIRDTTASLTEIHILVHVRCTSVTNHQTLMTNHNF